jgi:hypothetical protein
MTLKILARIKNGLGRKPSALCTALVVFLKRFQCNVARCQLAWRLLQRQHRGNVPHVVMLFRFRLQFDSGEFEK